jgi:hypothetical protein
MLYVCKFHVCMLFCFVVYLCVSFFVFLCYVVCLMVYMLHLWLFNVFITV